MNKIIIATVIGMFAANTVFAADANSRRKYYEKYYGNRKQIEIKKEKSVEEDNKLSSLYFIKAEKIKDPYLAECYYYKALKYGYHEAEGKINDIENLYKNSKFGIKECESRAALNEADKGLDSSKFKWARIETPLNQEQFETVNNFKEKCLYTILSFKVNMT